MRKHHKCVPGTIAFNHGVRLLVDRRGGGRRQEDARLAVHYRALLPDGMSGPVSWRRPGSCKHRRRDRVVPATSRMVSRAPRVGSVVQKQKKTVLNEEETPSNVALT